MPSLSIREQVICEMIISVKWDRGVADYCEVVTGVIVYYMQLFFGLNHLQDIIQGLVHKGRPLHCIHAYAPVMS